MMYVVLTLILALYGSMHGFVAWTLAKQFPRFSLPIYSIIFILTVMSIAVVAVRTKSIGSLFGQLGSYWMALGLLAFVIYALFHFLPFPSFWWSTACIVLLFAGGIWQAERLQKTSYKVETIPVEQPVRIALLSDIHLGYVNGVRKLERIVQRVNEEQPDVVFIAGDLFDSNFEAMRHPERIQELLSTFQSTYGTFLAWGNHDAGDNFDKMRALVLQTNIHLLEDEVVDVGPFVVGGRKDVRPIGDQGGERHSIEQALDAIDSSKPVFMLDHQPSTVLDYDDRIDLIVSGHTHRGQVWPFHLITQKIFPVDYGMLRKENGNVAIVSSGAGFWGPPIRIGTKSEYVIIELQPSILQ